MKKFRIAIEETVVDEFDIYANDAEEAMRIAEKKYRKGEIVLEPGDCQFRQMAIVRPNNEVTEWVEF